jgi:hypothetical protein
LLSLALRVEEDLCVKSKRNTQNYFWSSSRLKYIFAASNTSSGSSFRIDASSQQVAQRNRHPAPGRSRIEFQFHWTKTRRTPPSSVFRFRFNRAITAKNPTNPGRLQRRRNTAGGGSNRTRHKRRRAFESRARAAWVVPALPARGAPRPVSTHRPLTSG